LALRGEGEAVKLIDRLLCADFDKPHGVHANDKTDMPRPRRKVLSLTSAMVVAASLILLAIVYGAHLFSQRSEQLASSALDVSLAELQLSRSFNILLEAESGQRGFLLTADEAYLDPFKTAREEMNSKLAGAEELMKKLGIGTAPVAMAALRNAMDQKFSELEQTIALARQGRTIDAMAIVRGDLGRDLMIQVRDIVSAQRAALAAIRTSKIAEAQRSAERLAQLTMFGVMAVVILSLLAFARIASHNEELHLAHEKLAAAKDALEERVRERTGDLQTANDEIQRYAYIVGHDLRAPLVNIIGFTRELDTAASVITPLFDLPELQRDDPAIAKARRAIDEDIPEALKFIKASATRMDGLINAILAVSRLGRLPLRPQSIDLAALTMTCIASLQHSLNEAGASISIEGRLPPFIGDARAMEQVMTNLLDNAAKYLSRERTGHVIVRGSRIGSQIRIEIEDNGRGVAPSDHERIFELFRRSGKQDRAGEGIGLAHVRRLVRRMGGDIKVRSDGMTGSVFSITLPSDLRDAISKGAIHG
jgi:signal transduction histidine kinase